MLLSPMVAAVLLWTPYRLAAAWPLFASMAGSFGFDLAYHFLIPGPDNVFTLEPDAWLVPFRVSAVLLGAVSGLGTLVGGSAVIMLWRSVSEALSTVGAARSRRASGTEAR